ncbi:MAG TPA: ThiF family adenylyltransferase, partial [Mucilaginibacter sp.]|nr:ThiF family adenylyltransferase [Mucilaginibacter sp.]
ISKIILPEEGDRHVHGNVGFMPSYLERTWKIAAKDKEGIVFLHAHPTGGWQGMSRDDIAAETGLAPAVMGVTKLPLLGLTLGTDGAWSARFWIKNELKKRTFDRKWCENVRVISKKLTITFNDDLLPPNFDIGKQLRTISAWGEKAQEDLSRLRIGIIGLGSVGSMVAEILARTGISYFTLIDFDPVEEKNLDRLTNVFTSDIGKAKVEVIKAAILKSGTSPSIEVVSCGYSVCEKEGFLEALNCDIIFCCVDRPWPRQVINFISYAYLIPVVDGGILVRTNKSNTKLVGADWKAHTIGYLRPCLECIGQYKAENAMLEKLGYLDDPSYLKDFPDAAKLNAHENVFAFGSHLASMEVLQMLSLFLAPGNIADLGQQMYHFVLGNMAISRISCHENCFFPTILGKGDYSGIEVTDKHLIAEQSRVLINKK